MKKFVGSDVHFGHTNVLKFCPSTRPYTSVSEMDQSLITDFNSIVSNDDVTYLLGDITFHSLAKSVELINQLNGSKILIIGNHDRKFLKYKEYRDCFQEIHEVLEIVHNKKDIVMFHYPIHEWRSCQYGSIHLHGHCHGKPTGLEQYRIYDVGLDATGKIVTDLDEVISLMNTREIKSH